MTALPRIVSLLPSATEIAVALGLGDQIVGRSHECDYPAWITPLPVCTATKLEKGLTSIEIDDRVQEIVRQGLSVYEVDADLLRSLRPDIILTQSQCAVCAVTPRDLEEALGHWVGSDPALISLAPDTLSDVWGDLRHVADAAGVRGAAERVVDDFQKRLETISGASEAKSTRPTVAAIEWTDPLMAAGNWVPELVEIAGGRALFAAPGQHSPWLAWEDLVETDPDFIIMMPCGYQIEQTLADLGPLVGRSGWRDLAAVRQGRIFVADGHHFFNRPGPRLVESAEILAAILTRSGASGQKGEGWIQLSDALQTQIMRDASQRRTSAGQSTRATSVQDIG